MVVNMYNNFSLLNIIGGLSKTLNIANQMIPLYKQVKPLIANSNKVLSNLQNLKVSKNNKENIKQTNTHSQQIINHTNMPTFFQ